MSWKNKALMDVSKDSIMLTISNINISQESFQTNMEK